MASTKSAENALTPRLTHIDEDGRAFMVDVSEKSETRRTAVASGILYMGDDAFKAAISGGGKKGNVITTAEIAGIMAAKKTSDLIPMCHPLAISKVSVKVEPLEEGGGLGVRAEVVTTGKTGVEMEALTAASVACLTLYDMLKAIDKSMVLAEIKLMEKSGGVSGDYFR
ncbi:cyclic pyranopterin monophosphate synthase MoaC [Hirschia baltica]|uniref:Cyclic pyranopterin monophosphate synthase n=1 Tax=Hirschia baltica (strain ATCC 49814 / DSM 5838 / IFAM 1418) TaxID=582402 RepID=C6XK62_HIRBI|nr:cyclic pyranopterin monophosphate synthase MoaC [Hirschia baltica]ACT59507.1 molybdenum cofactor biosynthesis protein C [Hirschia baltica ATCC 49814]